MSTKDDCGIYTVEDKKKAAYALNLCTVSVSQIIDYNDINVLEQEYNTILNNLNLEQIPKDEALLDVLKQILDVITFFRISEEDKKFIDLEYQQRMKNAVWSAIPNVSMIFATSNPIAMGVTLATQVGIGYMNYRRNRAEYQLGRDKAEWQLKRAAMEQLNGLRKELFETSWRLATEYDFPDEYRLSDNQIHKYNTILDESNPLKRFNKLDAIRADFSAYPPYWYQLGSAANCIYRDTVWNLDMETKLKFKEHAITSFEQYRQLNQFNILRSDVLTSSWALEYVDLLDLSNVQNREDAATLIDIAEKYSGKANDVLELCAYAYLKIGDREKASQIFYYLVNQDYNIPITAKILSALYILKAREAGNEESGVADYKMLERLVSTEHILPMPNPDIALETWDPVWRTVIDTTSTSDNDLASFFSRAAHGDADAQCHIGICYLNGDGVEQNAQEAVEWFRKAAEQGHADAQNRLGVRYDRGEGVSQNSEIAAQWFLKAAKQGHAKAQYNIGDYYLSGNRVPEDFNQAIYWLSKAAEQGHTDAQFELGCLYSGDDVVSEDAEQAIYWLSKAAEQGHTDAQLYLSAYCLSSEDKIKEYSKQAVNWLQQAANQNSPAAQYVLGLCYGGGLVVESNPVEAAFWWKKAAEQEFPDALLRLGICYMYGTGATPLTSSRGVIKDLNLAQELIAKAIEVGEEEGFFEESDMAVAHRCLAEVIYAQNVRDHIDVSSLDIANCIPGVNFVSFPIWGIISLREKSALKKFLTTEDGRSMMFHCKTAAELGDEFAIKMLKKLKKAL